MITDSKFESIQREKVTKEDRESETEKRTLCAKQWQLAVRSNGVFSTCQTYFIQKRKKKNIRIQRKLWKTKLVVVLAHSPISIPLDNFSLKFTRTRSPTTAAWEHKKKFFFRSRRCCPCFRKKGLSSDFAVVSVLKNDFVYLFKKSHFSRRFMLHALLRAYTLFCMCVG